MTNPKVGQPNPAAKGLYEGDGLGFVDADGDGSRQRPSGEPLAFTIKANGSEPTHVRAAELVAGHLEAVGTGATVEAVDAAPSRPSPPPVTST